MQTPDRSEQEIFLELVRNGRSVTTSAGQLGYTSRSFELLARNDNAFAEELAEASRHATAALEDKLYDKAHDGSQRALEMWLKAHNPDKWGDRQSIAITGPGGGPIQVVHATVAILREVLTDPTTRDGALKMVDGIEAIEATAHEV